MSGQNGNLRVGLPTQDTGGLSDYLIHLNFLPVLGDLGVIRLYRRLQGTPQETRPADGLMAYRLPSSLQSTDDWPSYWVSFEPRDGFDVFEGDATLNSSLATRILFRSLADAARQAVPSAKFYIPDNEFIEELSLVCRSHAEGNEELIVQPYYLRAKRQYGYLMDYHFRLAQGIPFSRKVQQLSLSLDRNFRRNLDYYVDRSDKVQASWSQHKHVFDRLQLPGTGVPIRLANDFVALPAERLRSKIYVFGSNKESRSQYSGLRDHGPLQPLNMPPRLLFLFREQDRQAARTLAISLKGSKQRQKFSFPGFQALFKSDLEIDGNPIILPDLTRASLISALERVKSERQRNMQILPVVVLPEGEDNGYMEQKALFSHAEISTQVCTLRILQDQDALKWAIANLALQIFCKAGGQPWKVHATHERSLIIGISQSHKLRKVNGQHQIEKYFAFSVMTDSSGLFQKMQVLGESDNQGDYLTQLRDNLRTLLSNSAGQFARVVIHTSFKLKHREIDAIQKIVQAAAEAGGTCKFAVVKVNHRSRFFGINRAVNSFVPYEATQVKLGRHEYLMWFEGLSADTPTVNKAFPGPTHLQFLRVSDEAAIPDHVLLQDLVNLSGANWRGFNAKSAPVSVFYCHLVADLVHDFHERGLPLPAVKDIRPWFL